jgi:hypothetical protein
MAHRQILEVACVASATARPLHRLGQIAAAGTVQPSKEERELEYVLDVKGTTSAYGEDVTPLI